jgi:hypothetical protein
MTRQEFAILLVKFRWQEIADQWRKDKIRKPPERNEAMIDWDKARLAVMREAMQKLRDKYQDRSIWPTSGLTTADMRGHKSAKRVYALVAKELTEIIGD